MMGRSGLMRTAGVYGGTAVCGSCFRVRNGAAAAAASGSTTGGSGGGIGVLAAGTGGDGGSPCNSAALAKIAGDARRNGTAGTSVEAGVGSIVGGTSGDLDTDSGGPGMGGATGAGETAAGTTGMAGVCLGSGGVVGLSATGRCIEVVGDGSSGAAVSGGVACWGSADFGRTFAGVRFDEKTIVAKGSEAASEVELNVIVAEGSASGGAAGTGAGRLGRSAGVLGGSGSVAGESAVSPIGASGDGGGETLAGSTVSGPAGGAFAPTSASLKPG